MSAGTDGNVTASVRFQRWLSSPLLPCRRDLAQNLSDSRVSEVQLRQEGDPFKALVALQDVFHRHNAPLILESGTLLGW